MGVAGDFLSEVKPQSDGSNSIKYNLTPEMVKVIFRTYPEVKAKFLEVCPTEMSERDFWAKFFQSQYFHRDRLPNAKVRLTVTYNMKLFGDILFLNECFKFVLGRHFFEISADVL